MHPLRASLARTALIASLLLALVASPSASAQEAVDEPASFDEPVAVQLTAPDADLALEPLAVEAVDPVVIAPVVVGPTATLVPHALPSATPLPTIVPTSTPGPAPAAKVAAGVADNRFQPTALTVAVGSTVTWTNNGNNMHTLTSSDGLFDSGGLLGGQSFSFTFDRAGTYRLICRQHGLNGMAGQVVVQ
ncbi:MAG TPA: plastocyanin/azurin family copper-binding protein [Chloroflexota bacterium]